MAKRAVVNASELQRSSGKMLKRVAVAKEHLVVERDGYPVAVMMSFEEYEELMRERALAAHRDLVITLGKEVERQGLTEEQLMEQLEASKRRVYEERYGRSGR
jgi:prevent-host-death family protein